MGGSHPYDVNVIEIQRVGPGQLADLETLFSSRSTLRGCRCMIFRFGPDGTVPEPNGEARQRAMAELVRADVPVGLLGYAEDTPVAWCSVAPRDTFRGLDVVGEPSDPVWSITCFWIHPDFRRQGVMTELLDAAIREARTAGATELEAYPVDPDSPSYRFSGFVPFFEDQGFHEVGQLGSRRHVLRLDLHGASAPK